jgi:hypothetical protein
MKFLEEFEANKKKFAPYFFPFFPSFLLKLNINTTHRNKYDLHLTSLIYLLLLYYSLFSLVQFGAQSCVIAQAKRGGVDVILNESSKRLNPSLVSFVDKERALGEAATTQVSTFHYCKSRMVRLQEVLTFGAHTWLIVLGTKHFFSDN